MIQYIIYRETRFVETSFLMYKILTKPFLLVQTHTTCPYNLEVNRRHTPLTLGKDHFTADLHFGFSRLGTFIQNNKQCLPGVGYLEGQVYVTSRCILVAVGAIGK